MSDKVTIEDFLSDPQGRRYKDVIDAFPKQFEVAISFFNDSSRLRRMEESEIHHDRPAFAGVVKEFETDEIIAQFFETNDAHKTIRFRQAIGCLIKQHMILRGWQTTGEKGSLGTRKVLENPTTKPGAYINSTGLSKWFTKSERYIISRENDCF